MWRAFHLTKFGNAIVANNIIQAMIEEQAKMMNEPADPIIIDPSSCPATGTTDDPVSQGTSTSTPTPAATPPPYTTTGGSGATAGKCHIHVNEIQDCAGDKHNLATEVTIWDVGGNQIGCQSITEAGAIDPLSVNSKLEDPLIVIPENKGDCVQTALSWCSTGGWDPREGPACGRIQQVSVSWASLLDSRDGAANVSGSCRNDKWTVISSAHCMGASPLNYLHKWL